MQILIATQNMNKFKEIVDILGRIDGAQFISLKNFPDAPAVLEDGKTLADNACKKALIAARVTKCLTLADDSGLEVKYLGGAPGVYSSRFAGKNATYKDNNIKLLGLLKDAPLNMRQAIFRCVIALADNKGIIAVREGLCLGRIAIHERGRAGFGYDPVFIPSGYKKTFAEMGQDIKNRISHRAKALEKIKKAILNMS